MSAQDPSPMTMRLDSLEARLVAVEERLRRFDVHVPQGSPTPPPPPPVVRPPIAPEPYRDFSTIAAKISRPADPPPSVTPPSVMPHRKQVDDLEYKIGLTGLLRGGAAVIVVALVYLVGLAVSRHQLSPAMQFSGEILLCVAFAIIGFAKRNEKEEFGQLMVGIGSCGMYLSFAGGHLFKHLYGGEMLVALFLVLSFANFGFALWRSSRSFLTIGMIGGFIAAMMPMHRFNPTLDAALQFLVLVPAALIVARNRWSDMAALLWFVSTIALVPALTYEGEWQVRMGALYGTSLIAAATYAFVWRADNFDNDGNVNGVSAFFDTVCMILSGAWTSGPDSAACKLPGLAIGLAGIEAMLFGGVSHGSLHVLPLAIGGGGLAWAFRSKLEARDSLWIGSLAVAACLPPIGFTAFQGGVAYIFIAIALSLAALRFPAKPILLVAVTDIALATIAYLTLCLGQPVGFTPALEVGLLTGLMVATVSCAYAAFRGGMAAERSAALCGLAILPLFTRLGYTLFLSSGAPLTLAESALVPLLACAAGAFWTARTNRWTELLSVGWIALGSSFVAYLQGLDAGPTRIYADSGFVLAAGLVALLGAESTIRLTGEKYRDIVIHGTAAIIGTCIVRLSFLWLNPALGNDLSIDIGLLVCAARAFGTARAKGWTELLMEGWIALTASLLAYFECLDAGRSGLYVDTGCVIGCGLVALLAAESTIRLTGDKYRTLAIQAAGAIVGACITRLSYLWLHSAVGVDVSIQMGVLAASILGAFLVLRIKLTDLSPLAVLGSVGGSIASFSFCLSDAPTSTVHLIPLVGSMVAILMSVLGLPERIRDDSSVTFLTCFLMWCLFTVVGEIALYNSALHLRTEAAETLSWTVFAVILMATGFRFKLRNIRYCSLFVFGATVFKVFWFDLSNLDAAVRVAVLMALGVAMIGAGYWYIRVRAVKDPEPGI